MILVILLIAVIITTIIFHSRRDKSVITPLPKYEKEIKWLYKVVIRVYEQRAKTVIDYDTDTRQLTNNDIKAEYYEVDTPMKVSIPVGDYDCKHVDRGDLVNNWKVTKYLWAVAEKVDPNHHKLMPFIAYGYRGRKCVPVLRLIGEQP